MYFHHSFSTGEYNHSFIRNKNSFTCNVSGIDLWKLLYVFKGGLCQLNCSMWINVVNLCQVEVKIIRCFTYSQSLIIHLVPNACYINMNKRKHKEKCKQEHVVDINCMKAGLQITSCYKKLELICDKHSFCIFI